MQLFDFFDLSKSLVARREGLDTFLELDSVFFKRKLPPISKESTLRLIDRCPELLSYLRYLDSLSEVLVLAKENQIETAELEVISEIFK